MSKSSNLLHFVSYCCILISEPFCQKHENPPDTGNFPPIYLCAVVSCCMVASPAIKTCAPQSKFLIKRRTEITCCQIMWYNLVKSSKKPSNKAQCFKMKHISIDKTYMVIEVRIFWGNKY
jgi:hypothetical protein